MALPGLPIMDRQAVVAGIIPALFLYACGQTGSDRAPGDAATEASVPVSSSAGPAPVASAPVAKVAPKTAPPGYTDGQGVNEGYPDLTPTPLVPEAERTEKGATNVLISFARAMELKEFDQAWAMLSKADQRKWPKAEFTRMFADLGRITFGFDRGTMEGAAGSSFYTAPIHLTSKDTAGRPVAYDGEAVLRRVNDVDGATPAQLRWHFEKVTLDWTH